MQPQMNEDEHRSLTAFTLAELLVVIGILALLVATRLPALCRAKAPSQLIQCLNNCRQIGLAAMLYRADNSDCFPFGNRVSSGWGVTDPTGWPMQLLRYLGGYKNAQPKVYLCPSEHGIADGWIFALHYQANRMMLSDYSERDTPIRGAQVRNPAIYWMFMDKGPADFAQVRPGGLANPILVTWNSPPGSPQYRRHSGGLAAAAADGHADWLRTPPYQPGAPAPQNFLELGDCSSGLNPPSTWPDNVDCVKLYSRHSQPGF